MKLTPMMEQYLEAKEQAPGALLFFRLGDFYEMFFDDAKVAAAELGLTLTSRSGDTDKNPMCGVPYHAAETYVARLIAKGYKVAIAEQIGDPKARGLTKREIIKVVTPGTVLSENVLNSGSNNYIALIEEGDEEIALVLADVSTGECAYALYEGKSRQESLFDELYRLMMPELVLVGELSFLKELKDFTALRLPRCTFTERAASEGEALLVEHFPLAERPEHALAKEAVETLLAYLHEVVKGDLTQLNTLNVLDFRENLVLDTYTLRNLEITHNLRDGGKKGTLLSVLDFTRTAMGSRLLKKWLEYPLISIAAIEEREDAVEELFKSFSMRANLRESLKSVHDFERLLTRIEVGSANARDLVALRASLLSLPAIKAELGGARAQLLRESEAGIEDFSPLADLLMRAIVDEPGFTVREGGIIKEGYSKELDEYRAFSHDSKTLLQEMEEREREKTGIKTLKIGYNKVFGYYLEVRKSGVSLVPAHYVRKQTLANGERYITDELKDFETKILGAQEKIEALEYHLFSELREQVKGELTRIQHTAQRIALLDVLASLAEAASTYNYVRPSFNTNGEIEIKDGRHPLVERILKHDMFVPNDTAMSHRDNEVMLITGPNMAGKSTYMRQVALLVLMAQVGSFIPARSASICPVDRIFTRIGASDDLVSGQSTFMVEMNEVAQILRYATKKSLVILDEIGRGTSTFDGMSIARAVIEYIEKKVHAKTLFATHYHELTDLENDKIKNFCVAVKERGTDISFLRRIVKGAADKSYGIQVARLAGLPKSVTGRAEKILLELEEGAGEKTPAKKPKAKKDEPMTSLFASALSERLLSLDIMTMTPIEALNELYKLQGEAKKEAGLV